MANNFSSAVQRVRERRKVGQADAYRELGRMDRRNPAQNPAGGTYGTDWSGRDDQSPLRPATEPETQATEGPAVLPPSSGIEQPELSAAQQESGNKPSFASVVLGMMGRGGDNPLTAEEGRELRETGAQAAELNRAPETVNWEGRDQLLREYRRLRAAYDPANPEGEVNDRMQEVLRQLREGDEAAGNEARDYTWGDRATSVISGAAQNIGSSIASAASTAGQSYGRTAMLEQAQNMDQALRDLRFGEDTGANAEAALRAADEGNRAWEGVTAAADRLGAAAAEDLERAKGGLSGLGRMGVDIAENVLELGFDAAVGALTQGSSLASMFARTFGSSAQEARRAGADLNEQVLYGTVKGGIETLTEKMFDGVAHIYGAGAADDLVEKAIGRLADTDTGRTFLRVLSNAAGEGVEELVSGLLDPVAQAIYRGELGDLDPSELLYGVLMGMAIGLLGGTTSIATGQNARANAALRAAESVNAEAQTGGEAQTETAPAQEEASQTQTQEEADPAVQTVRDMLAQPVNRSQANRIINDPALRAAFEEQSGITLPGRKSEAAQTVMAYSQQAAQQAQAQSEFNAQEAAQSAEQAQPGAEAQLADTLSQTPAGAPAEAATAERADLLDRLESLARYADQLRIRGDSEAEAAVREQIAELQSQLDGEQSAPTTPLAQTLLERAQEGAEEAGPQQVGRATTIQNPYNGPVPEQTFTRADPTAVTAEQLTAAQTAYNQAVTDVSEGKGNLRTLLSRIYSKFQGPKGVQVAGMQFNGNPYLVDVPNNLPGKLANQDAPAESLAVLDALTGIISNGEYLGSGRALTKDGQPKKNITRYDYFESDVTIDGAPYIVKWDVENVPGGNNYKTHRLVNIEIDPVQSDGPLVQIDQNPNDTGSTPGGDNSPNPNPSIPQNGEPVNTQPTTPLAETLLGGQAETGQPAGRKTLGIRPDAGAAPGPEGAPISQTAETVRNAQATPAEFAALIDREGENGGFRYIPITNDATVQAATDRITRNGWEATLRSWSNDVQRGQTGAEMAAVGAMLYNNAVNSGNTQLALDILSDYTMLGRNTARGLQAMKIIQSLTPDARLYMIEKQVDQLSETLKNVPDGITIPQELKDAYRAAETEEARDRIVTQMQRAVAEQIPRTLGGFFTALRYLNMLGNFRTQGRNLIGNALMAATTSAKNGVLYMLEGIASRATNGNYERSISLRVDPELRQAAMEEFRENPDFISGESRYADNRSAADSFMQGVRDAQEPFGARNPLANALLSPLRAYNRATRFATEAGDRIFIGPRYARSLAGYLQANGMDAATFRGIRDGSITPTAEQSAMLERARDFAMQEAQEATFHDSNQLSDWVSKIGRKPGTPSWARVLSEGLLPFRKTPANVAVRLFEYSPLGAIDTAIEAYRANQTDSEVDMTDVLNSAAKSLTGTGIFVLGMLMRSAGRLRGHDDDEKQSAFDQMRGQQDYSYVTADGNSYTIDWASPVAGTLFMGSQLYDLIQEGGFNLDDIGEIVTRMSDPMIQMSMLQGVKDTLDTLSNSDNSLGDVAVNLALSYLSQAVSNSLLRQGERAYEDRRYSTFTTSDTRFGRTMQRQFGKWTTSVPGYDYNQMEYVDAWGRPDYNGSPLARGIENFLSPGYIGRNNSTEVDNELQRLYTAGQNNVFPQRIPTSYEVSQYDANGNRTGSRPLTQDEYVRFQRIAGQTSLEMVTDLMQSSVYASMSDEARGRAISEIYSYARNIAAQAVEPSTKKEYEDVSTLSNPAAYFGIRAAYNSFTSSDTSRDYDGIDRLLNNYDRMPQDVQALLEEKISGFRKLVEAHRAGVDSTAFFAEQDRISGLNPVEGNSRVVTWQRVSDIADNRDLSDSQRDAMLRQEFTEGALKKYDQCRDRGYSPSQIANFYRIYSTAGKKADIIAQAISNGFTRPQAVALYSMWHNGRWS